MKSGKAKLPISDTIYLIGFMAAGKSSVGKALASLLSWDFYDTDALIEQSEGQSIASLFAEKGEHYFRQLECKIIGSLAGRKAVVSLGGGAVVDAVNRRIMQETGLSIYLKWQPDLLIQRVIGDRGRPLVGEGSAEQQQRRLRSLFESRREHYEQADHIIECRPTKSVLQIADQIVQRLV